MVRSISFDRGSLESGRSYCTFLSMTKQWREVESSRERHLESREGQNSALLKKGYIHYTEMSVFKVSEVITYNGYA